jgi:FkbM family methyltransferase|tara:strand:- start:2531 stop:3145 length:615 start_codon:yes stop_codon:yes gene_type:complete
MIHEWIKENLPKDSIVVESGTAGGSDTVFFCETFTDGKVYGFEPIKLPYLKAVERTKKFSNVHLENVALGEKAEVSKFYVSSNKASSSLLKPTGHLTDHPRVSFNEQIDVSVINLDEWSKGIGLERVNLMWLDMQGYEWFVLNSSPDIMSKTDYIYSEVVKTEQYENGMVYEDFKKWMLTQNFVVEKEFTFYDDGAGNVLFKRQ